MQGRELRQKYIQFFESKGCLHLPSDSLVPNDPSLLFTSAGMVQFKPYFLGAEQPPRTRAVTAQKCLRTDDIDEVGDAVHHTFFEMMGNFSFGDYFKREAIHWAWEFMTEWLKLPADRIWTSVYLDDDEAQGIWLNEIGLPAERVVKLGADKNYWPPNAPEKGPNGPCGPCNEIFLDMKPEMGAPEDPAHAIAYDNNRFVEMWNLVFMQFMRGEDGSLTPLPKQNIDTGLGLERVTAILQGAATDYDTDLFLPLIRAMEERTGVKYGQDAETDVAFRTMADHARAAVFCVADGVMPSNVKRGYVLRRLIRRAAVKARKLGCEDVFMGDLARVVAEMMQDAYPEIGDRLSFIQKVLTSEEEKFAQTLSAGISRLEEEIKAAKASGGGTLGGQAAFTLYDRCGFPLELTQELCAAEGLQVDRESFEQLMASQRQRAREGSDIATDLFAAGDSAVADIQKIAGATEFAGYEATACEARIAAIVRGSQLVDSAEEGDEVQIVLDRSPFYAESGGQMGDLGTISSEDGAAAVSATRKAADIWLHEATVTTGEMKTGDAVRAQVDEERRRAIMRNHTATHLLHAALRKILGTHVAQAGSLVAQDRLRFDFSHFQAVKPEELRTVEDEVNRHVLEDLDVQPELTTLKDAREKGAMALFGEKYGTDVRTITIGEVSLELCGGTHLHRTSQIGLFKIVSEGSVAAGVRRIEAVTGAGAFAYVRSLEDTISQIEARLRVSGQDLAGAIDRLQSALKEQQQQIEAFQSQSSSEEAAELAAGAAEIDGFKAVCSRTRADDTDSMSKLADELAQRLGSAVVVLGSVSEGKVLFIAKVTKDLASRGLHAGNLVKAVARETGGGGGGRPDFAQAGGRDPSRLDAALEKALALIREAVA